MNPLPARTIRRTLAAVLAASVALAVAPAPSGATAGSIPPPTGVRVDTAGRDVAVSWDPYAFPAGTTNRMVQVERDGGSVGAVRDPATSFVDGGAPPGGTYRVRARAQRGGPCCSPRGWTWPGTCPRSWLARQRGP